MLCNFRDKKIKIENEQKILEKDVKNLKSKL
jgi:hypothetical protein